MALPAVVIRLALRWVKIFNARNLCLVSGCVALIYIAATVTTYARALDDRPGATDSGWIGGDYAAFYAAGRLVLQGQLSQLYDSGTVRTIQEADSPEAGTRSRSDPL